MSNALGVQIVDARHDLLEAALDFAGGHGTFLDGSIKITAGTVFHDFTPTLLFILNKIDSLHDIGVMQGGRDTEFGSEFLDILFLCLILPSLTELLHEGESNQCVFAWRVT